MDESRSLDAALRHAIGAAGPMPVSQFMERCLYHPEHGYYVTHDPLGRGGDFITAPEISQMFGELIGLWAAQVWRQMGTPAHVHLIELGPGRGTLMSDALRASRIVPALHAAINVHLVEISPALRERQRKTLAAAAIPIHWHASLQEVPEGPAIIIANEFFDALPVHQAMKQADGWHERCVTVNANGSFAFTPAAESLPHFDQALPQAVRDAPLGAIFEWRDDAATREIGRRMAQQPGAALVIDYGHTASAIGDTFQAVREHAYADPLAAPGLADLTAHVDFQALAQAAENMGAVSYGPVEQGEFLRRLGIVQRAAALRANATHETAAEIELALVRLTGGGHEDMGVLFKALALTHPRLGPPPGFEG